MPSHPTLRFFSPAKLNLHLEIFGKRDDGFHELETLMSTVSIHDAMRFTIGGEASLSRKPLILKCRWASGLNQQCKAVTGDRAARDFQAAKLLGDLPSGEKNLVWQTVGIMRDEIRNDESIGNESRDLSERCLSIELVKQIPSAAGLGGASSNSATTMLALNQLWKLNFSRQRLATIAARLGSDIPFFIYGGTAVCRGRGEKVSPVHRRQNLHAVVVRPPATLSTADVFRNLGKCPEAERVSIDAAVESFSSGTIGHAGSVMFNRLQKSAEDLCVWISRLKAEFDRIGITSHQLTGSGSCYFGVFANRQAALSVTHRLRQRGLGLVYACKSC